MIPYGRQLISNDDIAEVVEVLKSDFLTQGPRTPQFEEAVAAYVGAKYGIAVNSATSALHIACLVAGLGPGDVLWTSPNSFVASSNCGLYCGASVDFVDIDPNTLNISIESLKLKLEDAEKKGKLPKVVIPVHFAGQSCDMQAIGDLGKQYGFKIIEDASHAIGGRWDGVSIGSCIYSDMTVFSFHPVKIITTGEGGLITTNNSEFAEKLILLRTHGITRDQAKMRFPSDHGWYYEQQSLGFNYRITEMQAALGLSQLKKLDQFVATRHKLAKRYDELINDLPISLPWSDPRSFSAYHLYVIQVKYGELYFRDKIFHRLRGKGIFVNLHYIPIHTQPYYQSMGFKCGDFPVAEKYAQCALTLPMYPALSENEQDVVIKELRECFV